MKGLRFRRSIRLFPGLRANLGLRGISLSAGVRGARLTAGARGVHASAGIPGSGLSVTRRLSNSTGGERFIATTETHPVEGSTVTAQSIDPTLASRMGIRGSLQLRSLAVGAVCFIVGLLLPSGSGLGSVFFVVGVVAIVVGLALKSKQKLAEAERDRRITELNAIVDGGEFSRGTVEQFWKRKAELNLADADMPNAVSKVSAVSDVLDLAHAREENGGEFPTVAGHERIVGKDTCHFVAPVIYDKRGDNDEQGELFITKQRAIFMGRTMADVKWGKVAKVELDGARLTIMRRDRSTPLVFVMTTISDALRANFVASACLDNTTVE